MKANETESWALRILGRVEKKQPIEDSRVELKVEWPADFGKAARQIGGHANAANCEPILWLIGVDERAGKVVGANHQELSNWFSQLKGWFDGLAPDLVDVNVPHGGVTVSALCFDTSRRPYVVQNPAFGKTPGEGVRFEVPWREGASTRSATRSELIMMLNPFVKLPKIEILRAEMRHFTPRPSDSGNRYLEFKLVCYVTPLADGLITFPFHKCSAVLVAGAEIVSDAFKLRMVNPRAHQAEKMQAVRELTLRAYGGPAFPQSNVNIQARHEAIEVTSDEIVVRGAGKVEIVGEVAMPTAGHWPDVQLSIGLIEAVSESELTLNLKMTQMSTKPDEFWWVHEGQDYDRA
jgi:hypothetical protein